MVTEKKETGGAGGRRRPAGKAAAAGETAAGARAQPGAERYRYLAEASQILAESLDYERTLAQTARLAVPRLADWAAVDMLGDDGAVRRLAVAHVDPKKVELAHELWRRYPPHPDDEAGLPNVLRTGRSELYEEIEDGLLEAVTRDAEHLGLVRELGLKSGLVVPLAARGRTLGAITFVMAESGRRYTAEDLAFAEDLARRAAVAVDNARLVREAREAAAARDAALAELRDSEEQFRTLADSISQLAWIADPGGSIFWYNRRWYDYTGTTLEEMKGSGWRGVQHPDEVERVAEHFKSAVESGESWQDTFPLRGRDGRYRRFLSRALPIRDAAGRVARWFGTNTDVEEQLQAEERSRASERLFRTLTDSMMQLVWAADENGSHFYYNRRWYEYTGLSEERSLGFGFTNALHPDDRDRTLRSWERAWGAGEGYEIEYRFRRHDGEYRWFLGRATPVLDESGRLTQWVGTCTDIEEQKQMEVLLARLNEERERMLEEVSTPVVPVLEGVLVMPLIGSLDSMRMERATRAALEEVRRTGARSLIIDITGARIVDTHAVANLSHLVAALRLVGAEPLVTGVGAHVAQNLVGLGLDLKEMKTHRTLAQALAALLRAGAAPHDRARR